MYAAAELIPWGVHARVRNATRRVLPRELARTLIELRKTPGHTNAVLISAGVGAACALETQRASVDLARRIGVPVDAVYGPHNPDDYQRTPQGGTFVV